MAARMPDPSVEGGRRYTAPAGACSRSVRERKWHYHHLIITRNASSARAHTAGTSTARTQVERASLPCRIGLHDLERNVSPAPLQDLRTGAELADTWVSLLVAVRMALLPGITYITITRRCSTQEEAARWVSARSRAAAISPISLWHGRQLVRRRFVRLANRVLPPAMRMRVHGHAAVLEQDERVDVEPAIPVTSPAGIRADRIFHGR
jgi:hypothetical protein